MRNKRVREELKDKALRCKAAENKENIDGDERSNSENIKKA